MRHAVPQRGCFIVLTGLSGAGKSEVGRALAKKLKVDFIDLDKVIEDDTGMSVKAIFAAEGESRFRDIEAKSLKALLSPLTSRTSSANPNCIVALGGGTLLRMANVQLINKHAVLVWLQVSCVEAAMRLAKSNDRPLTSDSQGKQLSSAALLSRLRRLLAQRKQGFAQASIRIRTTGKSVSDICADIIRKSNIAPR